jgi:hypothetical protein
MSSAIHFLKEIDGYTPEAALESFKRAATKSGMFCFNFNMEYDKANVVKGGEGALCGVDKETLITSDSFDRQHIKEYLFRVKVPDKYNISDWLVNNQNYFEAIRIINPCSYDEGEFIFRFVVSYFEDNPKDYLWYDSASDDFVYTAADIKKLSTMPYNPMWSEKKLV